MCRAQERRSESHVSMITLAFHAGYHDASAALFDGYELRAAISLERLTRRKGDGGGRVPEPCIDEVLAIAGIRRSDVDMVASSRGALPLRYFRHMRGGRRIEQIARVALGREKPKDVAIELRRAGTTDATEIFDCRRFLDDLGFSGARGLHFYNHHRAHALPTLFYTDWDDALLYTADGGGDNVNWSHRLFRGGMVADLFGDDRWLLQPTRIDSLGLLYGHCTQALGFRINRHEGKLTGLAAHGRPVLADAMAAHFRVDDEGRVGSDFPDVPSMRRFAHEIATGVEPADVAASVQAVLERFILQSMGRLVERHGVRRVGLGGGVFANVRLNRRIAEELGLDEIFVFPAMSDEGLPVGGALDLLLAQDGPATWLASRRRLRDVYLGRDHGAAIDAALAAIPGARMVSDRPAEDAARRIAAGEIGAIYDGRMEFGPRALGARSILASPVDPQINADLNRRLARTDFMPFAPVVLEEDASRVFELGRASAYAARFMTVTCGVRPDWRSRIPAVVHVDGSARPQTIDGTTHPLYAAIVAAHRALTDLPVLINTSFNVHEEPIVNRPEECVRALLDGRVDFVVTARGVWRLG